MPKPFLADRLGDLRFNECMDALILGGFEDCALFVGLNQKSYTVRTFNDKVRSIKQENRSANDFKNITFHGGPPGKQEWFIGTFLIFALDCLMLAESRTKEWFILPELYDDYKHYKRRLIERQTNPAWSV